MGQGHEEALRAALEGGREAPGREFGDSWRRKVNSRS